MSNRCTLLIDGNWLLISRFSVMNKLFDASRSNEALEAASSDLRDMMAKSINIIINRFPAIDNIILIADGGSWRKQLPIPHQLHDITYKGNRSKQTDMAWTYIFNSLNGLVNKCRSIGITASTQANCEGDDWAWYWSRRLNDEGINCIIWSSDNDLKQLVQNRDGVFTAWYNDKNGIYFHDSLDEHVVKDTDENFLDIFMSPISCRSQLMESLISYAPSYHFVDPNTIITSKVICGDSGDNIKSVVQMHSNGRIYGVGAKDWEKISTKLNIITIQDLIENKEQIATDIHNLKKFYSNTTVENILEMIEYNIKLVWLNEAVEPESIISIMNTQEYKQADMNFLRGSYRVLCDEDESIRDIFECF